VYSRTVRLAEKSGVNAPCFPHPRHPGRGDALRVAGIELRDHFPLEPVVERLGFDSIQAGSSPCSWPSPNAHPTSGVYASAHQPVQFREIEAAVDEHLHAALPHASQAAVAY